MIFMSVTSRVVKNSSLLIMASIINNVMTFILTLFTARYLGTYNFGLISSATSFVGVFGIFCDLGLATYAIREVSRDKSATSVYFGTTFAFRVLFTLVTFIVYCVFVTQSNFTEDGFVVMILFGFYMVFNSIVFFFYSLFQSNEKMKYQTIGNVIYSSSVLLIILLIIFNGSDVKVVAAGYPLAMLLSLIYTSYIAIKHYPRFTFCFRKDFVKKILYRGIPFGITSVFTSIYFWIALIILTYLSGSVAVGLFSASQKLLLVIAAIFTFFSNAIFPVMSELYTTDKQKLRGLYFKLLKFMLMLGLSVAVGTSLFSSEIINIIYGSAYVEGSFALSILIWAGVFMFLSNTSSTLLGAINKQFTVTKIAALSALLSVVINYVMIVKFSYYGASLCTVIIEFLVLTFMLVALSHTEFKLNVRSAIKPVVQVVLSNVILAGAIILFNQSLIVTIPVAVVVYVVALLVTGAISSEDREIFYDLINSFRNRG